MRARLPWVLMLCCAGCSPTLAVSLEFADESCLDATEVALVVEEGACGARAGAVLSAGSVSEGVQRPLAPGAYCVDALAFRTGDDRHGHACRVEALARESRRLPQERDPIALSPACMDEHSALNDDLLAAVANCSGGCDVERCICSAGCSDGSATATCPAPVDVERLVMGNDYACGVARDRRSFSCWGSSEVLAQRIDGWPAPPGDGGDGVAVHELLPLRPGSEHLLFDGDEEFFCARDSDNRLSCSNNETRAAERELRETLVVGRGFHCGGEADVLCLYPYFSDSYPALLGMDAVFLRKNYAGDLLFASRLSAARDTLCGVVAGVIHCNQPRRISAAPCGLGGASCPWYFERCTPTTREELGECTPYDVLPDETMGTMLGTPVTRTPAWIDLDLGWGRGCAIDTARRLWCWSNDGEDRDGVREPRPVMQTVDGVLREVVRPMLVRDVEAREISVGREHVCVREVSGSVTCAALRVQDDELVFAPETQASFPGSSGSDEHVSEAVVSSFVAGPHGISCGIRPVGGAPNRVECFQLPGFDGGEALLGRTHTRDLDPARVDSDRADLAVCP